MTTATIHSEIGDKLMQQFVALIYEVTGIRISEQKKALLSNRLRRRLRATGIVSFDAYYKHLKSLKTDHDEWDHFLQEVTTHETYLFRDQQHWTWLEKNYLPEMIALASKGKRQRSLRIWSAASSTGDEAYTTAVCISQALLGSPGWKVNIVGTDIGIGAIEQANRAEFSLRAMRLVPAELKSKYFTETVPETTWKAKPALTSMIRFRQHNLLEPLAEMPFDLVFLKNVMIYFDDTSKLRVLAHIRKQIVPGGLLLAGAAEGVSDLLEGYKRLQPWLFQKLPS